MAGAQTLAMAELRGGFDASEAGILPGTEDDQSRKLQDLIDRAAAVGQPVFLPAGTYEVANLELRDGSRLTGVPGLTRLVYRGDGHLIAAQDVRRVSLSGITFDGANRWLADYTEGLLSFRSVDEAIIENCEIAGSRKCGVYLARSGGRITGSRLTGRPRPVSGPSKARPSTSPATGSSTAETVAFSCIAGRRARTAR